MLAGQTESDRSTC